MIHLNSFQDDVRFEIVKKGKGDFLFQLSHLLMTHFTSFVTLAFEAFWLVGEPDVRTTTNNR